MSSSVGGCRGCAQAPGAIVTHGRGGIHHSPIRDRGSHGLWRSDARRLAHQYSKQRRWRMWAHGCVLRQPGTVQGSFTWAFIKAVVHAQTLASSARPELCVLAGKGRSSGLSCWQQFRPLHGIAIVMWGARGMRGQCCASCATRVGGRGFLSGPWRPSDAGWHSTLWLVEIVCVMPTSVSITRGGLTSLHVATYGVFLFAVFQGALWFLRACLCVSQCRARSLCPLTFMVAP